MASVDNLDISQKLYLFERAVNPETDELLMGMAEVLKCAKTILLGSSESSVDFKMLAERTCKHFDKPTKYSEIALKKFLEIASIAEGQIPSCDLTNGQTEKALAVENWISEVSKPVTTYLLGETICMPIDPSSIEVPELIAPLMQERIVANQTLSKRTVEDLWCYEYAFMRIGEKRIFEVEYEDQYNVGDVPALLKHWGYQSVEEPQPGDLAVFLTKDDLEPHHVGVYRGNGKVESKWWNTIPVPFLHELDKCPKKDGTIVIFYRPPAQRQNQPSSSSASTSSDASNVSGTGS